MFEYVWGLMTRVLMDCTSIAGRGYGQINTFLCLHNSRQGVAILRSGYQPTRRRPTKVLLLFVTINCYTTFSLTLVIST